MPIESESARLALRTRISNIAKSASQPQQKFLDSTSWYLGALILLATILNGLPSYLRKIGVIDRPSYLNDISVFCVEPIHYLWLPASCHYRKIISVIPSQWITINVGRIYTLTSYEIPLKLIKYAVILVFIVFSLLFVIRKYDPILTWRQVWPILPLLLSFIIAFTRSTIHDGFFQALIGSISSLWILLIPICTWLTVPNRLQNICDAITILIISLLPLALLEAMVGLPSPFGPSQQTLHKPTIPIPSRLSQIFIQPNSLGAFLVIALAFCFVYSHRKWLYPFLTLLTIPLLLLARSATGITCLILLGWYSFGIHKRSNNSDKYPKRTVTFIFILTLIILPIILPILLGRSDLWFSISGRTDFFLHSIQSQSPLTLFFGRGTASSGSVLQQIYEGTNPLPEFIVTKIGVIPALELADSTLQLILNQQGLLGMLSFYSLLFALSVKDWRLRPFFILVILCSFTVKIGEIFPIQLLVAISINSSLQSISDTS